MLDYFTACSIVVEVTLPQVTLALIDSALLLMRRYEERPVRSRDEQLMFRLVRASFNQRRKTLCNALSAGLGMPKETVAAAIAAAGLPESIRGEALSMAQFAALSDAITEIKN